MITDNPKKNIRILIVDDTPQNIEVLGTILKREGYQLIVAQNGIQALKSIDVILPDLILLDVMMPKMNGFETCKKLKISERTRDIPVIFLTARAEQEDIVQGFAVGGVDYIIKPFYSQELLMRVHTHLMVKIFQEKLEKQHRDLVREIQIAKKLLQEAYDRTDGALLGESNSIVKVREEILECAKTDTPILLTGPPGAGDETIARPIHRESSHQQKAFIYVNCNQYHNETSSQLFSLLSHRRDQCQEDLTMLELADGGTLYLDRIHMLPISLQKELAVTLREMEKLRKDGKKPSPDVKIIAYTSIDFSDDADESPDLSSFDYRLYHFLSRNSLKIPSLYERIEDVPALVEYFVHQYAKRIGKMIRGVSDTSMVRLRSYPWPGNIRELKSVLERTIVVSTKSVLNISEEFFHDGQRLNSYRLIDKLGEGGMGEVWRAKHQTLARPVALKVVRMKENASEEEKEIAIIRFKKEAQETAKLQSPNTIRIFDYGVSEQGAFYFVMELLYGMNLDSMVLQFGALPFERAIMLLMQACRSLMEAHDLGLIHRDIKPQNLFACKLGIEYDVIKILDFGIVKAYNNDNNGTRLTDNELVMGSPITIAPEIIRDSGKDDPRSDIYSLGCVAYWMVTGSNVFEEKSPMKMLVHHVQSKPIPPSQKTDQEIPKALEDIIMQCLEKRPGDRPFSAYDLWNMLRDINVPSPWSQEKAQQWWRHSAPNLTPGIGTVFNQKALDIEKTKAIGHYPDINETTRIRRH